MLRGGETQPHIGLNHISSYALAKPIHMTDIELGFSKPLIGSFLPPPNCLGVALRERVASIVIEAQGCLS
jgi:hypothetical protein